MFTKLAYALNHTVRSNSAAHEKQNPHKKLLDVDVRDVNNGIVIGEACH